MEKFVNIRESLENDKGSIRRVHLNAFGQSERDLVSQLAVDLVDDKTARPILSLVAEQDNRIVGNIIFSSVTVEGDDGVSAYILAPLAVIHDSQGQGIGTELIRQGIETLTRRGAEIVFVLGDPNYYAGTGFKAGHNFQAPSTLEYPEAWMAQELVAGVLGRTHGMVRCASSLSSPELW